MPPRSHRPDDEGWFSRAVAVIGIAARFPGSPDYHAYWRNLSAGRSQITEVPADRFDWRRYYGDPVQGTNKTNSKWGGFLDSIDRFDAAFFGISPREADLMDPQQRFMLEMTWHCLEDAGYAPSTLARGRVGVYIGVCNYDYKELEDQFLGRMTGHRQTGSWTTCIPNRVSYWYNFHGPSFPIDTGCSSSLLTVHSAIQSLRLGECDLALAGGVSLICSPLRYIGFGQLGMLSPTGRCWTFDAAADGYVRGEGAGLLLLKPLTKALEDGDPIYGVIRGSASNHGGRARTLTSPNAYAQTQVIVDAHLDAGVSPDTVTYIETHGTGTPLGDPIEIHGLKRAFQRLGRQFGVRDTPAGHCGLGTVKTYIGHTEAAAGVAGLINVLLSLKHRALPGLQNFRTPNPRIELDGSPFYLIEKTRDWNPVDAAGRPLPRRAGISSFGAGGANAHLVIEEAPGRAAPPADGTRSARVIALSAKSDAALRAMAGKYAAHLAERAGTRLGDVALTTTTGREHLDRRLALVAESTAGLAETLRTFADGGSPAGLAFAGADGARPFETAFLFTGQGSQYGNMGRGLFESRPVFRRALERCDAILRPHLERPLLDVLYGSSQGALDDTACTQPALFALEYALSELWRSWGIRPAAVIGHSVGEFVAATIAGVFGLEDALRLVAARGRLMQALPRDGAMVAVFADEARVARALATHRDDVSIAAVNGTEQVVVSGRRETVQALTRAFAAEGVRVEPLVVSHAFHSPLMRPMLDAFEKVAGGVTYAPPAIPFVSNVTGALAGAEVARPSYWRDHVLAAVRFHDGLRALHAAGHRRFLEIGPRPTLSALGRRSLPVDAARFWPSLRKEGSDLRDLLETVAALHVEGAVVDWSAIHDGGGDRRIALPTYPFEARRYWLNLEEEGAPMVARPGAPATGASHPLLGRRHAVASRPDEAIFESTQSLASSPPFLADHRVFDTAVVPAVAIIEMMLAGVAGGDGAPPVLEDVEIRLPLVLGDEERTVQCIVEPAGGTARAVRIFSRQEDGAWRLHASASAVAGAAAGGGASTRVDRAALETECPDSISVDEFYQQAQARGLAYGPGFRAVDSIRRGVRSALGRIRLPEGVGGGGYLLHPVLFDGGLQVLLAALPGDARATWLPVSTRRVRIRRDAGQAPAHDPAHDPGRGVARALWSHARLRGETGAAGALLADVKIFDDAGALVAEVEGLTLRPATPAALRPSGRESWRDWLYEVEWRPKAARGAFTRPDWLPSPGALDAALVPDAAALPLPADRPGTAGICERLEAAALGCTVAAFRKKGFDFTTGDRVTEAQVVARLGVVATQKRLVGRLLESLAEEGILRRDGDVWVVARTPAAADPTRLLDAVLDAFPEAEPELSLLRRTGPHLADVLDGRSDPLQLLFPGGDTQAATHLYEDSLEPRAANTLVARAVVRALERQPKDGVVRILEIGAGTGATTASVLPVLCADRAEYTFTDITAMFTAKARDKFHAAPFVRYGVLDVEVSPETQGFEPGSFDLVLAANVIHATRDLAVAVENIHRLLAPGGLLLLLEGSARRRWIDLTFGLLEGWWRFADHALRPAYPLIGPEAWTRLLMHAGYDAVETVELPRDPARLIYPQSVVIARAAPRTADTRSAAAVRKRWLVCGDASGVGSALADRLRETGDECTVAVAGSGFKKRGAGRFLLDPTDPTQVRRLLSELDAPPDGVVHLFSLDTRPPESLDGGGPVEAARIGCLSALNLVQALVRSDTPPPGLWLVTRGARQVVEADPVTGVTQAGLWGMAKAITLEHPELRCVPVDLDPDSGPADVDALARELRIGDGHKDDHVAFRRGARYMGRLRRVDAVGSPAPDRRELPSETPFRLHAESKGTLDALRWAPAERTAPGPGEVEIGVRACGLNFVDVMDALGLAPDARQGYGLECAGEITAVGAGVSGLREGDEVVAVADGCMRQYVVTPASLVVKKPPNLSMAEAASIPANFLTAHYALNEVAKVARGETVLVHVASGGTGMAAVQLALSAGAEVWGTASPGKWPAVKALGVTRVMSSRTLDFADQIGAAGGGRGVDVVLNSLAGEFIPKSFTVLKEDGRFLEIGKTGVYTPEQASAVRPRALYATINLFRMCRDEPAKVGAMLRHLIDRFAAGELHPVPIRELPATDVVTAFRTMQGARHVGKLVVTLPAAPGAAVRMRPDATYLVVGGLGGLGPSVAGWLAQSGARHVALMGRRGVHEEARERLQALEAAGVAVRVLQGDVTRRDDVERALEEIRASMPPLRGVIHSAGLLDDGILMQQSWERFAFVMGPKMDGAWHLHALTRDLHLDFFVLFSSVASLLGSKGQANHSAANAFLDSLAAYRRARGLPGLSINWGAWSGIGAAARRDQAERWSLRGMDWIPPDQGIEALAGVFLSAKPQTGVVPITDWGLFLAGRAPSTFFESVGPAGGRTERADGSFLERLRGTPVDEQRALVIEQIRSEIRTVLGFDSTVALDARTGFFDMGMDSLTSVELRNRLQVTFGAPLSSTVSFDHPNIGDLAGHLMRDVLKLEPPAGGAAPPEPGVAPRAGSDSGLDDLSDEELAEMLGRELSDSRPRRKP
jgi:acyl transferase domain-containing protein/NADPH:quinone reductase-like Zn-dependent oxidoreductase/acyl carrier protein